MHSEAWTKVDYEQVWGPFDDRFDFRPSIYPKNWPAIEEPAGSVTLDLAGIFKSDEFGPGSLRVAEVVLASFLRVYPEETTLLALDWQHPAYHFRPHLLGGASEWPASPFSPFPNGDYYIFLTEDMSQGTFGHPWEQTLCVWGDDLVRDLVPTLQLPVKRAQR